ncbi:MAG: 1-deoxy-D-xylulose-5-phosphate reductoisomerase, partial [Alphaproteobacteria bacterium]|nr:1-deoxy-D-xylulose-5-phosphate reductoisomerase [Alphaproteobacteria bacterium]
MTRKVSIFGATGSVGQSTLDLIRRDRDAYDVVALTANSDLDSLAALARESGAKVAVIGQERLYGALKEALAGTGIEAAAGEQALVDVAGAGADWTMAAIVGCAGLRPTMAALKAGGTVALANKESL